MYCWYFFYITKVLLHFSQILARKIIILESSDVVCTKSLSFSCVASWLCMSFQKVVYNAYNFHYSANTCKPSQPLWWSLVGCFWQKWHTAILYELSFNAEKWLHYYQIRTTIKKEKYDIGLQWNILMQTPIIIVLNK